MNLLNEMYKENGNKNFLNQPMPQTCWPTQSNSLYTCQAPQGNNINDYSSSTPSGLYKDHLFKPVTQMAVFNGACQDILFTSHLRSNHEVVHSEFQMPYQIPSHNYSNLSNNMATSVAIQQNLMLTTSKTRIEKGNAPCVQLAITLNECCQLFEQLVQDRKSIETSLAHKYPTKTFNYENALEVYRLPSMHSRVDRLIQDQKMERARIIMLLIRAEDAVGKSQEIDNIRQKINTWDEFINMVCVCRFKEREITRKNAKVPPNIIQSLAISIKQLTGMTSEVHNALWSLAGLSRI